MEAKVTKILDEAPYLLDFVMLRTYPPQLLIHAWGEVPTTGWSNARLVARASNTPSADNVLDLDFVAEAPSGVAIRVNTPIPVDTTMVLPGGVSEFRVHGQENSVEKSLPGAAETQQADVTSFEDDSFVPIPWIQSALNKNVGIGIGDESIARASGLAWKTVDLQQQQTGPAPHLLQYLRTERAKIAGGWLVRTLFVMREQSQPPAGAPDIETTASVGLTFVPDAAGWV